MNSVNNCPVCESAEETHQRLKSIALFLSRYAAALLACGTTTIRIEKNVERIAESYGTTAEVTIFPLHIMMTVWDGDHNHSYTNNERISAGGLNFAQNSSLSTLSWRIADRSLPLPVAERMFKHLTTQPRLNKWLVLILVGFANASFCRLFNGDAIAMLIVFIATIDGFYLKNKLHSMHVDIRMATIIAGCFSAIIATSGYVFNLGNTPEIALATSVLYLVPGIPYINAVSDLIYGHYICSICRFITAAILTGCLALGLILAILLMDIEFF